MKQSILVGMLATLLIFSPLSAQKASALSCLSVDMYLKDVVGKEDEIVIFEGTVTDQIMEDEYTAEVIAVTEVKQGYAPNELFAYHQKDATWGYMCNAGPAKEGDTSIYISSVDNTGTYTVHQRLSVSDPLVTALEADLSEAKITGSLAEVSTEDRMNQIMTTINDLFKQIQTLFDEYIYLKMN